PMYGYMGALCGMGVTFDELFAMMGATAEDGPMLGEAEIDFLGDLRTDVNYQVRGEIVDVVRKSGRRVGTFDILTLKFEVLDGEQVLARSIHSMVFPRAS